MVHNLFNGKIPAKVNGDSVWLAQYTFADLIGHSPKFVKAKELALQAAKGGSSVLLMGESGTGKEMFAHAIHAASARSAFPFVPVDCAAIPRDLFEAEMFGYCPGAFTNASKEGKPGMFELALGGTIFLDEVAEIPLNMQGKLLRVLQDRRVVRIGGVAPIPVASAIIAATNKDLESMVSQGLFRRDLMYRLDVIRIDAPRLCERLEDIAPLILSYWKQKSRELERQVKLSSGALRKLEEYTWPGNVRELMNIVERLLVSSISGVVDSQDLPDFITKGTTGRLLHFPTFHLQTIMHNVEKETLERALKQCRGIRTKAAHLVGLSRATFYRKLLLYHLDDNEEEKERLRRLP